MEEVQAYNTEIVKDQQFESMVDIAKRYPRNLQKVVNNSIAIATMDKATAETCNYSLPRGNKKLSGASVHLARIIVQQYGNLRVESRTTGNDLKQVHAEAVCFDLESNVAVKATTSKSIVNKSGQRFGEDMIVVTGKAAAAIAYRNAVFSVIPKAIIDKVYNAAMREITGDLSTEDLIIKDRAAKLAKFKNTYAVSEDEVLQYLGLNTTNQIRRDEIVILIGMLNSLKDGETSVEAMFERKKPSEKTKVTLADFKQDIADLKAYKIGLDMIRKKYNDSDLTDAQIAQIKEAGTITEKRMDEVIKLCVDGDKTPQDFEQICSEKQLAEIYEALTDGQ